MIDDAIIVKCNYIKCKYNLKQTCALKYINLDEDGSCRDWEALQRARTDITQSIQQKEMIK